MEVYEVPGIGRVYSEKLNNRSARICAEIAEYARLCLTLEIEPMREGIEREIEEVFKKYENVIVSGFVKGLSYVATLIEMERRATSSPIYM